jgi:hypothetical protein
MARPVSLTPRPDALYQVLLPDGSECCVYPLTYGRARIVVGPAGAPWYDRGW